jgi:hypothetical protein
VSESQCLFEISNAPPPVRDLYFDCSSVIASNRRKPDIGLFGVSDFLLA